VSNAGDDELKVLGHFHPSLLAAHPKPFFGYSDNTNLHLFLWNLGLVSYLGGSVMVQFGLARCVGCLGRPGPRGGELALLLRWRIAFRMIV
jgi:hypothetical protein